MEALAVIECSLALFRRAVERAALYTEDGDVHDEMFVRITPDGVATPASVPDAMQASYCTVDGDQFDRLDLSTTSAVDALFDVTALLGWFDWLETDYLTARFVGEAGVTSKLVIEAGETTVELTCEDDPAVLNAVEMAVPERFDGTTFLDEEGNPYPTRVETTAATLTRLVEAVDHATGAERYPVLVRGGALRVDVIGEHGTVDATLAADVNGPAVTNHYGPSFARVVNGLDGPVTLQTGPGDAIAFVQDGDGYTLRFVVEHV